LSKPKNKKHEIAKEIKTDVEAIIAALFLESWLRKKVRIKNPNKGKAGIN
jgi:hypothetical protein